MSQWREESPTRWVRTDGAVVCYNDRTPNLRPWKADHRGWVAFGPGPDKFNYLKMRSKRGLAWPKRFKTAASAMKAVDAAHPPPARHSKKT